MSDPHVYHHHPWVHERKQLTPPRVADQLPSPPGSSLRDRAERFNTRLALFITTGVGTMWCAYIFAAFDLLALPTAVSGGLYGVVQWVASFFLQLVLLSIIMVGQNVQSAAADKRALLAFNDGEAALHEILASQHHLAAQDEHLARQDAAIAALQAQIAAALKPAPQPRNPQGRFTQQ